MKRRILSLSSLLLAAMTFQPAAAQVPGGPVEAFGHIFTPLGRASMAAGHDHLTVSNIGSSGLDGVDAVPTGPTSWVGLGYSFDDAMIPEGGGFRFSTSDAAGGDLAAIQFTDVAPTTLKMRASEPIFEITPDFAALGASTYSMGLFSDGELVQFYVGLSGPAATIPPVGGYRVQFGFPLATSVQYPYRLEFADPVEVSPTGGVPEQADTIVFIPDGPVPPPTPNNLKAVFVGPIIGDVTLVPTPGALPELPGFGVADVEEMSCQLRGPGSDVALVEWTNAMNYDEIKVYVEGQLVDTLPGDAEMVILEGIVPPAEICIVACRNEQNSNRVCCTVRDPDGTEPVVFNRGDCNNDGNFNIADGISVLNHLFGESFVPTCDDACDSNDDGALNIADGVGILNALFGGGAPLPDPHGDCGEDPTADPLACAAAAFCN